MEKLIKMGVDLYHNRIPNFSASDANEAFRQELLKITNGKEDVFQLDPMEKHKLFNLIQVSIDMIIPAVLGEQYDRFVEARNVALGDKPVFTVSDTSFFPVATVADGVNNVRKQRLDQGQLVVPTKVHAIKIADDMNRLLANRIDWSTLMNRISMSFVNSIKVDIYNALVGTYSSLPTQFKENGSFDPETFNTLIQRVSAYTYGSAVNVFGTKLGLNKVLSSSGFTAYPGYVSQDMMNEINQKGYTTLFQGTPLIEVMQAANPQSTVYDFAINNSYLFVIPTMAERIVKLVYEGQTIMKENMTGLYADNMVEYTIFKKYGVGVLSSGKFGIYQLA